MGVAANQLLAVGSQGPLSQSTTWLLESVVHCGRDRGLGVELTVAFRLTLEEGTGLQTQEPKHNDS